MQKKGCKKKAGGVYVYTGTAYNTKSILYLAPFYIMYNFYNMNGLF